ncbi:MAG: hypothetical protein WBQ10_23970 [Terriglobales bacterium]
MIDPGLKVPIDKRWPSPAIGRGVGNSVIQGYDTRPQQVPSSTEVLRQKRFTNMLKHAHAHNLVILPVMIHVAVVRHHMMSQEDVNQLPVVSNGRFEESFPAPMYAISADSC